MSVSSVQTLLAVNKRFTPIFVGSVTLTFAATVSAVLFGFLNGTTSFGFWASLTIAVAALAGVVVAGVKMDAAERRVHSERLARKPHYNSKPHQA